MAQGNNVEAFVNAVQAQADANPAPPGGSADGKNGESGSGGGVMNTLAGYWLSRQERTGGFWAFLKHRGRQFNKGLFIREIIKTE
eukprot:CAMPEP_0171871644 /NCGR_PEP_ID=MMETSP0992-20121227/33338_1 /TAXON_ID=483369 /ORGANISM="non described non described, Strain CCMP2098" /LENGTH=84 /DNA_ID=CAMNT_0012495971 /DNA_START=1 /DNA_END=251 /DNA_ORIENTATION=+